MKIAVFNCPGASKASVLPIHELVETRGGGGGDDSSSSFWEVMDVSTADLETAPSSWNFHVLILPGGDVRKMREALSPTAVRNLQEWRRNANDNNNNKGGGGGLIGICAGAVVAISNGCNGRGLVDGIRLVNENRWATVGLYGDVAMVGQDGAPPAFLRAVKKLHKTPDWDLFYSGGPVMELGDSSPSSGRTVKSGSTKVWARYGNDLASETLTRLSSYSSTEKVDAKKNVTTGTTSRKGWRCSSCFKEHTSTKNGAQCCGMKRREHVRYSSLVQSLVGIMAGKAAVVAKEDDGNGSCRCVFFGPHPEMGIQACRNLLVESIRWVAQQDDREELVSGLQL